MNQKLNIALFAHSMVSDWNHGNAHFLRGVATVQLFTDFLVRLMKYVEFMKKVVPLHDDLFDFFYDALPGYEHVGERRILLGCWGSFQDPKYCDYTYQNMTDWGRRPDSLSRQRRIIRSNSGLTGFVVRRVSEVTVAVNCFS